MFIITDDSIVNINKITSIQKHYQVLSGKGILYFYISSHKGNTEKILNTFQTEEELLIYYNKIIDGIINKADYVDLRTKKKIRSLNKKIKT